MKKLMTALLGASLAFGAATAFAQETKPATGAGTTPQQKTETAKPAKEKTAKPAKVKKAKKNKVKTAKVKKQSKEAEPSAPKQ